MQVFMQGELQVPDGERCHLETSRLPESDLRIWLTGIACILLDECRSQHCRFYHAVNRAVDHQSIDAKPAATNRQFGLVIAFRVLLSEATSSQNAVIIKLSRGFPTNIIHRLQSTICHHSLETLFEQFVCRRFSNEDWC